jgi:hypothetical protein
MPHLPTAHRRPQKIHVSSICYGPPGYVASWRSLSRNMGAIRVAGSPFKTLAGAEEACRAMLGYLGDAASLARDIEAPAER